MIPSMRRISEAQAAQIDLADDSGLKSKATFEFFGRQAGGRENLGYTEQDQRNYLKCRRQRNLIYGEAGSLLRYLHKQSCENPSFQYAVQLDNEEHITNIFWADARMVIDYAYFGDVITFDTTYSTNREYRPFGVFVGFNPHREIVIFGAALLYDETAESFKWLFQTFLDAHKQKRPKTIFTDQDHTMAKALANVLPETYHGLCTWHIMQNGIKHMGNLMKDGSSFLKDFKACMYEYEEELQFQVAWDVIVREYKVGSSSWLDSIYKAKEKWAKCYMKGVFTIGMLSTQFSESLNGDLKDYLKSNMDIIRFFNHFERVVSDKRYKELVAEYKSRQKLPRVKMQNSPVLQQAGKIYTPLIFERFQEEFDWSLATIIKQRDESPPIYMCTVSLFGKDKEDKVEFNSSDHTVFCSCLKFQSFGIFCCHALKVLDLWDIKTISDQYILKRWTREAKNGVVKNIDGKNIQENANLNVTERYKILCPMLVKLASRASDTEQTFDLVVKLASEALKRLKKCVLDGSRVDHDGYESRLSSQGTGRNVIEGNSTETLLQNVKGLKKKKKCKGGRRLKSWVEKQSKKKKQASTMDSLINQPSKDNKVQSSNHPNVMNPVMEYNMYKDIALSNSSACINYGYKDFEEYTFQGGFQELLGMVVEPTSSSQTPQFEFFGNKCDTSRFH